MNNFLVILITAAIVSAVSYYINKKNKFTIIDYGDSSSDPLRDLIKITMKEALQEFREVEASARRERLSAIRERRANRIANTGIFAGRANAAALTDSIETIKSTYGADGTSYDWSNANVSINGVTVEKPDMTISLGDSSITLNGQDGSMTMMIGNSTLLYDANGITHL